MIVVDRQVAARQAWSGHVGIVANTPGALRQVRPGTVSLSLERLGEDGQVGFGEFW